MSAYLLAIDQGTTSSRAIIFNEASEVVAVAQQEFKQYFPRDGWVEHDPEEIWASVRQVVVQALQAAALKADDLTSIGITNQRETTVIWDRVTGEAVHPAIVWQDRRTAEKCEELRSKGLSDSIQAKTGLLVDPYFSGTKVNWILDQVPTARVRAEAGELAFGTIDSFLLWRLTAGKSHKTDATNAARTLMFNIHEQQWDQEILDWLDIPAALLPEVEDSSADFGRCDPDLFGASVPIGGIAGDQQAALIGQGCFTEGMTKSTYGTGCFVIMNTGHAAVTSKNALLTTVAYRLKGKVTYGLEGSIFVAGAAVQWLRDELKLITSAAETEALARSNPDSHGVYMVPAFTGLGAPYWDAEARGAILGLTRDSGIADIVTATLQSMAYQTRDLLSAMRSDGIEPQLIRVDGGMVANDWMVQYLADILQITVDRPQIIETTALGAAYLAGLQAGVFSSLDELADNWQLQHRFSPEMDAASSTRLYEGWLDAVRRVRSN
ncbi:MAG: glycerol kinase GlpK [Gammaproteobacteria bacterium]|jgi:glycerol kinase|nr:glycerol kinase GlpK [Gammaproteobacteria bacterium]MBT5204573.1 glycerol kinase GlpK [Gammaproteobacteria bacterium]MBT5604069.1 glycerol kinase GlpK [Gammaproteobacteria bacterium]MBT6244837.1 glycerol kinase GlpK [Gammaproteobacteria bacterium]